MMGTDSVVNECSTAYFFGELFELGFEIAATGGSVALKPSARKVTQSVARSQKPRFYRLLYPVWPNHNIHHLNPLKGMVQK